MAFSCETAIAAGTRFVVASGLLNFGVFTSTSRLHQTLNFLGATGFTYPAISAFNPGLFITKVVWAVVTLYGL